ncbi:unnamed protein product [Arabidopsis lyrata]|nr:unnamed protein product [Arabidopsis lyrata]
MGDANTPPIPLILLNPIPPGLTTAAAASASQTTTSCLFIKRPFVLPTRKVCGFNGLCFNKRASLVVKSKRPFSCNAIYNPQVQTIQEYQSETFDYIVFFQDGSGKKYLHGMIYHCI